MGLLVPLVGLRSPCRGEAGPDDFPFDCRDCKTIEWLGNLICMDRKLVHENVLNCQMDISEFISECEKFKVYL